MRSVLVLLAAMAAASGDELPLQVGVGGAVDVPAGPPPGAYSQFPIESPNVAGMTGYLFVPDKIPPGRKVPLLVVLHGNGDSGEGRHRNLSRVSTADDPIVVAGIQYQKEVKFNAPLWGAEDTLRAFDWLLAKMLAEQPVDSDNVYVQGFSMGCGYAGGWAYERWRADKTTFPFRALFFVGSPAPARSKDGYPPVPIVAMVGEKETAVLGSINVVASVKTWTNQVARAGLAVEYHEIPGMEHAVNPQCHAIIRETIVRLRGPRDLPAAFETGELAAAAALLRRGQIGDGYRAVAERAAAKDGDAKAKKQAQLAKRKLEDWAVIELKRREGVVTSALAAKKELDLQAYRDLRSLAEAFPAQSKRLTTTFASIDKKHATLIEARDKYLAARALETTDVAAAKRALTELAVTKAGVAARAAAYRLVWWMD